MQITSGKITGVEKIKMRKVMLFVGLVGCVFLSYGDTLIERIGRNHKIRATDVWYGFSRTLFDFEGYEAWIVEPKVGTAEGHPWTWTMQWASAFVPRTGVLQLLAKGWHHVTIMTFEKRMDETGLAVSERFQRFLVEELGFSSTANLIGMSWGGFFATRYAARYPKNVSKIYLDCPFLNLGGCCQQLDIGPWATNVSGCWIDDKRMPINLARELADAKIPILLVYGGADNVLDPRLNSEIFIPRFKAAGGNLKVIYRESYGHHPHGFEESDMTIADFFGGKKIDFK